MTARHAGVIRAMFGAAIARVDAGSAVSRHLELLPSGDVQIDGRGFATVRGVYALAFGKASVPMMKVVEGTLGDRLSGGLVITKTGQSGNTLRSPVIESSHPVPDGRSLAAGDAVLRFADRVPEGALVLCLISGGGSSLIEALRPGVDLDTLRRVTSQLLHAGASIRELNAVRSRLSAIKGGGLLARLRAAQVVNLVVSDVLGDDLSAVASGPTVSPAFESRAEDVLNRYGVSIDLPDAVTAHELPEPVSVVVANLSMALDAAADAAGRFGYPSFRLSETLEGEARDVARTLASIVADSARGRTSIQTPASVLAGGETVVTVRGDGSGGRNTEGALAAAVRLSGTTGATMAFLATDGDDGTTGSAGAIVDGSTVAADALGAARDALARNDSASFLRGRGALFTSGPTGTNVNDLVIGLIG